MASYDAAHSARGVNSPKCKGEPLKQLLKEFNLLLLRVSPEVPLLQSSPQGPQLPRGPLCGTPVTARWLSWGVAAFTNGC